MNTSTVIAMSVDLYDHQIENAVTLARSIAEKGAALDTSDTGTGKSYTALSVAEIRHKKPFVFCPKSVGPSWETKFCKFGMLPEDTWWINYEKARKDDWLDKAGLDPKEWLLIFDECHRVKGKDTLQARLVKQAKEMGYEMLFLSATPAATPLETRALFYAHGITGWGNWWSLLPNFGCRKQTWIPGSPWGWKPKDDLEADEHMKNVRALFGQSMVHTPWRDVDGFPEYALAPEIVRLSGPNRKKLDDARMELDPCNPGSHTVERVLIEDVRVATMVELTLDLVEQGHTVISFFNFRQPLSNYWNKLRDNPKIRRLLCTLEGSTPLEIRAAIVDRVQKDTCRVLACQSQCAAEGIDLHDVTGKHPRVSLISLPYSATIYRQILGRTHRAEGRSRAVFKPVVVSDTVEQSRILPAITRKMDNLSTLLDTELY
jgi:hypothetical protein